MELKTFRAPSINEALAAVKAALGQDAVVVATKPFAAPGAPGGVEVTAHATAKLSKPVADAGAFRSTPWAPSVALPADLPPAAGAAPRAAAPAAAKATPAALTTPAASVKPPPGRIHTKPAAPQAEVNPLAQVQRELAEIKAILAGSLRASPTPVIPAAAVPRPDPVDAVLRAAGVELSRTARGLGAHATPVAAALAELAAALPAVDLPALLTGPVALVGACGCGKTTALVKLASAQKFTRGQRVAIVTLGIDPLEAEALARLADAMEVPFASLDVGADLSATLADLAEVDLVLIDTPGLSAADGAGAERLRKVLEGAQVRCVAVMTATASQGAAERLTAAVRPFAPGATVLTRLDEAGALGAWVGVLSGAKGAGVPVGAVAEGPAAPEGLEFVTSASWAARILASRGTGVAEGG